MPEEQVTRDEREELAARPQTRGQRAQAGAWLNKRAVALIEVPFEHTLAPLQDGWRLEAVSAGPLTVHLVDGKQQKFELAVGDHLSTAAEEMYLHIAPKSGATGV